MRFFECACLHALSDPEPAPGEGSCAGAGAGTRTQNGRHSTRIAYDNTRERLLETIAAITGSPFHFGVLARFLASSKNRVQHRVFMDRARTSWIYRPRRDREIGRVAIATSTGSASLHQGCSTLPITERLARGLPDRSLLRADVAARVISRGAYGIDERGQRVRIGQTGVSLQACLT
jgi:hypothetical protein